MAHLQQFFRRNPHGFCTIQVPPRDNVVVIVEKWRDLSALEAHAVAPHMTPYRESIKDYVVQITAQILAPTDDSE